MWWSITIVVLLIVIYFAIDFHFEENVKKRWVKTCLKIVKAFTLSIAVSVFFLNYLTPILQKESLQEDKKYKNAMMKSVVDQQMDSEDLIDMINLLHKELFKIEDKKSEEWLKEFNKIISEKEKEHKVLVEKELELIKVLTFKFSPIIDFALNQFDKRVDGLQQQNISIKISESQEPKKFLIRYEEENEGITVRRISFSDSRGIKVLFYPGIIKNGVLVEGSRIEFYETIGSRREEGFAIQWPHENLCRIAGGMMWRDLECTTKGDPIVDEKMRANILSALNLLFENVYINK